MGCWNEFCDPAVACGLLRKSLPGSVEDPAWLEKLFDGRRPDSLGRVAGLLPPKPAEGDGGVFA